MRKIMVVFLTFLTLTIFFMCNPSSAQVIRPKARATPSQGPTIEEAQKEDYMGPKARVAVTRFENKSAKGSYEIGEGMAEMLGNALFATNRFIVLERQAIGDVLVEQDFGASGRVRQETAPRIGEIEGADLLIMGTITEFEPGASGMGGEGESSFPLPRDITRKIGDVLGGVKAATAVKKSHVALIVKVIDARTGRRLASEQIEGSATDIEGLGALSGGVLSGSLSGYSKTPMEKAVRIAIEEAVRVIVAKTPKEYYRESSSSRPPTAPMPQSASQPTPITPMIKSTSPSGMAPSSEERVVYVKWPKVSLREGPGTNFKPLIEIQKGTPLAVIGEQGSWFQVRLEDGQEGWIGKGAITENP